MAHEPGEEILHRLGRAAVGVKLDTLPAEVAMRAKHRVLDTLGCLIAGYNSGISGVICSYALAQGGTPQATLLPGGTKTTASLAALAHGTYIHGLELSDVVPRASIHPGNEIIPAALAIAEWRGLSGAAIVPAVVVGYEVEVRIGHAVFPNAMYRGWWTPGMFGAIGPAVTVAHLLGLNATGIANAIGIVLNLLPSCMLSAHHEGSTAKWLMGGHACATGILAAEMAAQGVEGMRDIAGGWLPVVADKHHPERLTEGVSENDTFERWDTAESVVTKYHATVGPAAAPLDAICDLIAANDIRAEDIAEIELTVMRRAATFFCDPNPANEIAARASLPYCLAAAAVLRDPAALLGRAFRPEILTHPLVRDLAGRVRVVISEEYERRYPVQSLARVALRLRDGREYDQERDRHLDTRYSKPTDADIESKFRLIATPVLGSAPTDQIVNLAFALDTAPGIGEIMKCLTLPPRVAG